MERKYKTDYLYTPTVLNSSPVYRATVATTAYPTCKSAFESDPDVIMMRHRLANRMTSRPTVTTQRLTNRLEPSLFEPKYSSTTRRVGQGIADEASLPTSHLENGYMNLISCRIKKEGMGTKDLEQDDPNQSDHDTIESTHLDSDYAKSPNFPSEVYGSRPSVNIPVGIYSNKVLIKFYKKKVTN